MFEFLGSLSLDPFVASIPVLIESIVVMVGHKYKTINRLMKEQIKENHVCQNSDTCPLFQDDGVSLRPLSVHLEEFNLNFLFAVVLITDVIISNRESIRIFLLIWVMIILILNFTVDHAFCRIFKRVSKKPILVYSVVLWVVAIIINYAVEIFNTT